MTLGGHTTWDGHRERAPYSLLGRKECGLSFLKVILNSVRGGHAAKANSAPLFPVTAHDLQPPDDQSRRVPDLSP